MFLLVLASLYFSTFGARLRPTTLDLQFDSLRAAVDSDNVEVVRSLLHWITHTEYGSDQEEAQVRLSSIVLHATLNAEFGVLMAFATAGEIGPCDPPKTNTKLGLDMLLDAFESTASRLGARTQQGYAPSPPI